MKSNETSHHSHFWFYFDSDEMEIYDRDKEINNLSLHIREIITNHLDDHEFLGNRGRQKLLNALTKQRTPLTSIDLGAKEKEKLTQKRDELEKNGVKYTYRDMIEELYIEYGIRPILQKLGKR